MSEEKAKKVPKEEKPHYVDNKEFLKHMKLHIKAVRHAKKNKLPIPPISEYIGTCIFKIAHKIANRHNFSKYPFREEMISDGIENTLQYINNFNPRKSTNPYGYVTQIIWFAFVRRIQKEKKYLYTKFKLFESNAINQITEVDIGKANNKYGNEYSDSVMRDFVENFEKSKSNKVRTKEKDKKKSK